MLVVRVNKPTSQENWKVVKTHIHAEHDGVPVELHEDPVGQLHQADRGARGYESDAATGCL